MQFGRSTFLLCAAVLAVTRAFAADQYVAASVDSAGPLRITTSDGRTIAVAREPEQEAFDEIVGSPDGSSVGRLAEYPFCCTSYPIPLKLVIYTAGHARMLSAAERAVAAA